MLRPTYATVLDHQHPPYYTCPRANGWPCTSSSSTSRPRLGAGKGAAIARGRTSASHASTAADYGTASASGASADARRARHAAEAHINTESPRWRRHPRPAPQCGATDPRPRHHELHRAGSPERRRQRKLIEESTAPRDRHAARRWMAPGLEQRVTMDLLQEAFYRYFPGLTMDGQPVWPARAGPPPLHSVSDRGQRHARHRLVSLHRRRVCRDDGIVDEILAHARQPLVCLPPAPFRDRAPDRCAAFASVRHILAHPTASGSRAPARSLRT